jgi:hypothetical protein
MKASAVPECSKPVLYILINNFNGLKNVSKLNNGCGLPIHGSQ